MQIIVVAHASLSLLLESLKSYHIVPG